MSTVKKIGIVLILIGFGLSLVSLKFVSNYDSRKGVIENIKEMEVVVQKQRGSFDSGVLNIEVFESYKFKPRKTIPYLYILIAGTVLILAGLCITKLSKD